MASTTTAAALAVAKTNVGLLTLPNVHSIAPGVDGQNNLANPTSLWGVLRQSQGGSQLESGPNNTSSALPAQETFVSHEPTALSNLAAHITQDTALFKKLGWHQFVAQRRSRSDFALLDKVDHPAQRLLKFYKERGAPVKMATKPWSRDQISAALSRGAHHS